MESNIIKAATIKKSPPASLHLQILNEVKDNILSGKWRPGFRIPFEKDMAKEHGCSRMTVNKALTQLTRAGLLERTRKGGTFVKAPQSLSAALEITNIRKEVEDSGKKYSYSLLEDNIRACTDADFEKLEPKPVKKVRVMKCLHSANGAPFCYEERIINMNAVPEIEDVAFDIESAGAWMLNRVPWNSAEHQIIACAAPDDVANALDIEPNTACLVIERKTQNDLGYVTWARLSYAGDNHRLFATFTPTESV